jgi:hypothetical protein
MRVVRALSFQVESLALSMSLFWRMILSESLQLFGIMR